MADKEVTVSNSPDDLFSDEALGLGEVSEGKGVTEGEQSSPTSTGDEVEKVVEQKVDFGGLPFKSQDEFIRSHKSLQESYRQSREEIYRLKEMVQQFKPLLDQLQRERMAPKQAEEPIDIPDFLQNFINTGPKAIEQVAGKTFEERWKKFEKEQLSGLRSDVRRLRDERQVDKFLADHPEIKEEDEDALLAVVRATPWIRQLNGTLYEKLEAALDRLLRKEPTRFSSRGEGEKTLSSMKQAATSVGAKAGTRQRQAKDEFDEVLERDNQSRSLWR